MSATRLAILLLGLLLGAGLLGLSQGEVWLNPFAVGDEAWQATVLWEIRLPRVLLAMAVGAVLGMAGAALQGLLRNPLADPGIVGVSAGAGLGAITAIVFGGLLPSALLAWVGDGLIGYRSKVRNRQCLFRWLGKEQQPKGRVGDFGKLLKLL